jgi:thioredoxin 2
MIARCASCQAENRLPAKRVAEAARCARCKAPLLPLGAPVELASDADFQELVSNAPLPVLVDFWAAWCGPCRVVAPELEKIARQKSGSVVVAKVNTEALPSVAARFRIESIPTLLLFRAGKESTRLSGAQSAANIVRALGL